ncbi:MAG: YitT family protein [Clostridiaceae bacterium]|nr:YitT family protein [Clostridiaceae bacterium]
MSTQTKKKLSPKEWVIDIIWITISAALTAVTVNLFFMHTDLAPGGLTGLAIILSTITGIPLEYMTLVVSVPLLILGMIFIGSKFGIKTLYITLMIPVFIKIVPKVNLMATLPFIVQLIIAMIVGGLLIGLSIGIALRHDCATGGTDLLAVLIKKIIKIGEIPTIVFICDGLIIIFSGFIAKNVLVSVFSFLTLMIIIPTIKISSGQGLKKKSETAEKV